MRSTVDVHGLANTDSEAVTVPKVNVEVDSVHVLLQVESVILTFAEIAGSVVAMVLLAFPGKEVIIMNAGT